MATKQRGKAVWLILLTCMTAASALANTTENDLCHGFFALVNRPTVADSPCTVPSKKAVVELGYQYQNLINHVKSQEFPFADFRLGLPANSELFALLPHYIHHSVKPTSGFGPTSIGFKHKLIATSKLIASVEGLATPASGSRTFGNKRWGGVINGIFYYSFTKKLSLTCQLGVSTRTQSTLDGGKRFNSVNPDAYLAWTPLDKLQVYAEIYGQSKTAPHQGAGFNVAGGLIILVTENMTIDVEGGQRLRGQLGNLENYVGAGAAVQF